MIGILMKVLMIISNIMSVRALTRDRT